MGCNFAAERYVRNAAGLRHVRFVDFLCAHGRRNDGVAPQTTATRTAIPHVGLSCDPAAFPGSRGVVLGEYADRKAQAFAGWAAIDRYRSAGLLRVAQVDAADFRTELG